MSVNNSSVWQFEDYIRFASHQSNLVRKWVQNRLVVLYPNQSQKAFVVFLNDSDETIASYAAIIIGNNYPGDNECGLALLDCFKKSHGDLASNCAIAIGKIGYKEALPELIKQLNQGDTDVLPELITSLGIIKSQEAKEALLNCFNDTTFLSQNTDCRSILFSALLIQNDLTLIPILVEKYLAQSIENLLDSFQIVAKVDDLVNCFSDYSEHDLSMVIKKVEEHFMLPLKGICDCSSGWFSKKISSLVPLAAKLNQMSQTFLFENGYSSAEWEMQKNNITNLTSFEQGILIPLSFLSAFASCSVSPKGRDKKMIFKEALFLLACYLRIRLDCEAERAIKEGREQAFLFDTIHRDEKYQAKMIMNRIIEKEKDVLNTLIEVIQKHPDSWSAVESVNGIKKLAQENPADVIEAIPTLFDGLKDDKEDLLCNICADTLRIIGQPILREIDEILKKGDASQKISLMEILGNIPTSASIKMLLDNADDLFTNFDESFLYSLKKIVSKDAIPFLEKEWRQGERYIQEVLLLHYEVHGLNPPHIKKLRKEHESIEKMLIKKLDSFDDLLDMSDEPLHLKLRCLTCSKVYTYEIEEIFYNMDGPGNINETDSNFFIKERIVCKNCQAIDQYEITAEAKMILMAENLKTLMIGNAAKKNGLQFDMEKHSRIQYVRFRADNGKKLTPWQVLSLYQQRIAKEPDNYLWRIRYGNTLRFMKRHDEALEQYKKAVELNNSSIEAYINLGTSYEEMNNLSKAIPIYQKILELASTHHVAKNEWQFVEEAKERLIEIGVLKQHIQQSPPLLISSPIISQKIGRNQKCPCGSEKKYKHCCLK
ncbi:MAG: HEAT repeat domain-containing protein [Candidatus Desantisbacteria bacterium]